MDLLKTFIHDSFSRQLFSKNHKIVIAVSGGMDSVTLLHLFCKIKDEYPLQLRIAHLNHGLRGAESDRDERFVINLAKSLSIPYSTNKVDVTSFAQAEKFSIEEAARILRYRFLDEELQRLQFDLIALGHNANDQAETIMDHFLRGSGIRGLAGMSMKRAHYIRPLLNIERKQIETYVAQQGLNYVTDSSNHETVFKRNKIRHQLLPALEQDFNPAIVSILCKTGGIFGEYDRYFREQAKKAFSTCCRSHKKNKIILDIDQFFNYFYSIQLHVLYYLLETLDIQESRLNYLKIQSFFKFLKTTNHGARFLLNDQWELLIEHDTLVIHKYKKKSFNIRIEPGFDYPILDGEKILRVSRIELADIPKSFSTDKTTEYIDYDKIEHELNLRNINPGDRFIPLNMKGHKKVSDFFTDSKVPLHLRNDIPLLVNGTEIIWIVGYQIDDRFKITNDSRNILKLEVKEANNE